MSKYRMSNKGIAFVLSAPSGTGKTTLARALLKLMPEMAYSISATTRSKRLGEEEGRDYFFLDEKEFVEKDQNGDFLESAQVYGNWYGTPKSHVDEHLNNGTDILLDVDVQGAASFKKNKLKAVYIFLVPPSLEELEDRLQKRKTEDSRTLERRLSKAEDEIKEYKIYDYVVINDQLEEALQKIKSIVLAEKCRMNLKESFLKKLLKRS